MNESKENEQFDFSTLSKSDAWLMLLYFVLQKIHEDMEMWEEFSSKLIYENRFFSDHQIITVIHENKDRAKKHVKKGQTYYRARRFHDDNADRVIDYVLRASGKTEEELKDIKDAVPDYLREMLVMPQLYMSLEKMGDGEQSHRAEELFEAWERYRKNVRFKGYNGKKSSAPPSDSINEGRGNPAYIRCLYLSEDSITPVYEVKPQIGDQVSVARFKAKRELELYDLTGNSENPDDPISAENYSLFHTIAKMFSEPGSGQKDYIPTQFIVEEIKRLGFDGVCYNSSLHSGGVNVVLFEPDDCIAVSSDLVEITGISIDMKDPYDYGIKS